MEVVVPAAATSFVEWIGPKLLAFLDENHELRKNLDRDIIFIKSEFEMISATIKQYDSDGGGGGWVQRAWIKLARDMAHGIEDCIDRFTHRVRMADMGAGWLRRAVHRAKTAKARSEFAAAIRELRKISEDAHKLKEKYTTGSSASLSGSLSSELDTAATDEDANSAASVPVGMDAPRDELLGLIQEQEQQLKVITIVGFHGIGKSLLAKHVYSATESQYQARVWVSAKEVGAKAADVLKHILRQLGHLPVPTDEPLAKIQASIKECIGTKR